MQQMIKYEWIIKDMNDNYASTYGGYVSAEVTTDINNKIDTLITLLK